MKKSKIVLISSTITILTLIIIAVSTGLVSAGFLNIDGKKEISNKIKKSFDEEHDKIIKGKVPITEKEINDSADAGNKLKEKGIQKQKLDKEIESIEGKTIPTKEKIISQINLGISITSEAIEDFCKKNSGRNKEESLNSQNEANVKQLEALKNLKEDLISDKISLKDAWERVLEIRDGKE